MSKPPHDLTHEDQDPSIHTGVGNPLSPYTGEALSQEDEKRMDDKGRKVVHGKLWSQAGTGRYLVVALHGRESATCLTPKLGQSDINIRRGLVDTLGQPHWTLSVLATEGRPRFLHDTVGASLEIPEDLAEDVLKVQYVTEWLINTVNESLQNRHLAIHRHAAKQFAAAVADAAQVALARAL